MVIRCFPVSSYMCAVSFCICMVHISIFISFLGLHSFIEMYASGIINGGGTCLVSLFCFSIYYVSVKCMLFFGVVVY